MCVFTYLKTYAYKKISQHFSERQNILRPRYNNKGSRSRQNTKYN